MKIKKNLFKKRKKAKMYVLQSMYIWTFNDIEINKIKYNLLLNKNFNKIDINYFDKLLYGIINKLSLIDKFIMKYGYNKIYDISVIELNIIRIAVFEFIFCTFIPYKVVISEALLLNKIFGADLGYIFVNKMLDSIIKKIKLII
ncbi:MAG: transcription antitermination factor NusB [Candidatus Azosocius agrarius]|nr:MAG: transcription antitermination factor NusB [Gammaproteobacteria bacterium]